MHRIALLVVSLVTICAAHAADAPKPSRPNFVIILADDLGYGDLGCYGSTVHRTPHIDRLAAEGLRFTDFHSNGPMCSATRAALLTGSYQHRFGRGFEGALSPGHAGLPLEAVTLADALREAGYATGIFGKWHLGFEAPYLPTRQGFDEFRGLVSGDGDHHTHVDRSGQQDWWNGESIASEEGYTADLLTRHSIDFLERHRDEPFFLYVPHLAIHFPWQGPSDPPHRRVGTNYDNDKWGVIPDRSNVAPHVKQMVEALDRSVGAIIDSLRRLELDDNTFVFFTGDNGGYISYAGGFKNISSNGPLRGQKTEVYEGGHRVPAIAWWPSRIAPGVCEQTALSFDLMPTLLRLSAAATVRQGDGIDLGGLLFQGEPLPPRTLFWRIGQDKAARAGRWKLVYRGGGSPELFDLSTDLGELRDLASAQHERVDRLLKELAQWESNVSNE